MPEQDHVIFEIGEWTVDPLAHTLTSSCAEYVVPAKVMAVLVYLVHNQGRLVTRNELIDAVWNGNAYVGEKALNNAIWRIRQVVGRDANDADIIKTTPKTGYQLVLVPHFLSPTTKQDSQAQQTFGSPLYWIAAMVVVVFVSVNAIYKKDVQIPVAEEPIAVVTQLPGRELYAAPSPDGTKLAFLHVSHTGDQDLYIQAMEKSDAAAEQFSSSDYSNFSPSWAPDSRHLAYMRVDKTTNDCEVIIRDFDNGAENIIDNCIDIDQQTLSWSPDGQWLVFRKPDRNLGPGLYLKAMRSDYLATKEIPDRRISCVDCQLIDEEVSWSPDSRSLAVTRTKSRISQDVYRFDIENWEFTRLTRGETSIQGHAWYKDGENILYVAKKHSLNRRIWLVNTLSKAKQEIGFEGAGFPVYSPDYKSVLYYRREGSKFISSLALNNEEGAQAFPAIVLQTSGAEQSPTYSDSADKIAYFSNISGHNEIWVAEPDGSKPQQLTLLQTNSIDPAWSADGTKIAFLAFNPKSESADIKIYDLASKTLSDVPIGFGDLGPITWSADGLSLIVPIWHGTQVDLWRVGIDGDQLTRLVADGEFGRESMDGQYLYYTQSHKRGLFKLSFADQVKSTALDDIVFSGIGNWTFAGAGSLLYRRRTADHSEIVQHNLVTQTQKVVVARLNGIMSRYGMMSYSKKHDLLYFTHQEARQIDILMASDPLAFLDISN